MNVQHTFLPSLKQDIEWQDMKEQQKRTFINKTKSEIAVMLIEATYQVRSKNYNKARQLFFYIADTCRLIKQPDSQIMKWSEVSFRYIGLLHLNKEEKVQCEIRTQTEKTTKNPQLIKLKYNKFFNQFELDCCRNNGNLLDLNLDQDVLKYVSKINCILFGTKNSSQSTSIFVMFTSYWIAFLLVFAFLFVSFLFLAKSDLIKDLTDGKLSIFAPELVLGFFCIFPIIFIFAKSPYQKGNIFFQKKIGECIKFINDDCIKRGKSYQFLMLGQGRTILIKQKPKQTESGIANQKQTSRGQQINSVSQQDKQFISTNEHMNQNINYKNSKNQQNKSINNIFIYDQNIQQGSH